MNCKKCDKEIEEPIGLQYAQDDRFFELEICVGCLSGFAVETTEVDPGEKPAEGSILFDQYGRFAAGGNAPNLPKKPVFNPFAKG